MGLRRGFPPRYQVAKDLPSPFQGASDINGVFVVPTVKVDFAVSSHCFTFASACVAGQLLPKFFASSSDNQIGIKTWIFSSVSPISRALPGFGGRYSQQPSQQTRGALSLAATSRHFGYMKHSS